MRATLDSTPRDASGSTAAAPPDGRPARGAAALRSALCRARAGERGTVIIAVALFLILLIAFVGLGVDIGRWYLVRAELSKSVDAGGLEGARNINNPYVDPRVVAQDFCEANFPVSYLGTAGSGTGTVSFDVQLPGNSRVRVDGTTSANSIFASVMGFSQVPVSSEGVAQKKLVEIMMVLDRSFSLDGRPIADLKVAARSFLEFFAPTQATDKVGMVSFATSVRTDRALASHFVAPMRSAIDAMSALGATNTSDAFAQTLRPGGFTDQTHMAPDARVQQFMVFFSDGMPTAFRDSFRRRGHVYDAVACVTGNCVQGDGGNMYADLGDPSVEDDWLGIDPTITGDGNGRATCRGRNNYTTHWLVFDTHPVPGHGRNESCIAPGELHEYTCTLVRQRALDNATALKQRGVVIYCIGLGPNVDQAMMEQIASSPDTYYHAPTSDQLEAIFQQVAQQIQLRLVQ
jgi:Flp pilus assembly protein TadG